MAMVAVRFAARRLLTGQQPQAILRSAVANEQGVLTRGGSPGNALRRFTSSEAPAANGPKVNTKHPSVSGDSRLMAADQKKEELFDLLNEIQKNKDIIYPGRKEDVWLLQRLTTHVVPRPSDPNWRRYRGTQRLGIFLGGTSTLFAFLFMMEKGILPAISKFRGQSNNKGSVSCAEPIMEE